MTYIIEVHNEHGYVLNQQRLKTAATVVLSRHNIQSGTGVGVVIETNQAITKLNKQYRAIDAPTDVLTFPAEAPPVIDPDEVPYLGDIIIAFAYAQSQAERLGHNVEDNLVLLVVHGTLHLLGYDHDTPDDRSAMWEAQEAALRTLGISPDIVPALEEESYGE